MPDCFTLFAMTFLAEILCNRVVEKAVYMVYRVYKVDKQVLSVDIPPHRRVAEVVTVAEYISLCLCVSVVTFGGCDEQVYNRAGFRDELGKGASG
jgi:hypothetical protein